MILFNFKKKLKREEEFASQVVEILEEKLEKFIQKTTKTYQKEIFDQGCIGGIAEIYDSIKPHLPKGTINQAWSVSEVFRIILRR